MINISKNCQIVNQTSYIICEVLSNNVRFPISPQPHQHLFLSVFFIIVDLVWLKWNPLFGFPISLWWPISSCYVLIGTWRHLYTFFEKKFIQILALVQTLGCFELEEFFIFLINTLSDILICKYFSHFLGCLFSSLVVSFEAQTFKYWRSPIINVFFGCLCLCVISKKALPNLRSWRFIFCFFPRVSLFQPYI